MSKFTKEELENLIDARIRSNAGFHLSHLDNVGFEIDDEKLKPVFQKIFDSIVRETQYDENLLDATRAVRFSVGYIRRVVKRGIKDGLFKFESLKKQKDVVLEVVNEHYEDKRKSD